MKKYSRLAVALAVACCVAQAGQAFAGTQTFDDETLVFPNYTGTNTVDTIVGPKINSITVVWDDNGILTKIVINSSSQFYQWDSLFINTGDGGASLSGNWTAAEQWDYLVHTNGTVPNGSGPGAGVQTGETVPGQGLYAVDDNYDYTHASSSRVGHVNGIDAGDLTMLEAGFGATADGYYFLVYDFASLSTKIQLTDNFVIGYSPYCANDVILAYGDGLNISGTGGGKGTGAVPEPATIILFGVGIAGLAGWGSRRMKK